MDVNPILDYGIRAGLVLGVTQQSKMKWLKLFVLHLPFFIIIIFNIIGVFEGDTDIDNVIKVIFNILLYLQTTYRAAFIIKNYIKYLDISCEFKTLQKNFGGNKKAEEHNDKVQSKMLNYIKLLFKIGLGAAASFSLKPLVFGTKTFSFWTWDISLTSNTPYFQMILFLEILVVLITPRSIFGITIIQTGLITDIVFNINVLKEEMKSGMMQYLNQDDKDKNCIRLLTKCVKYHCGIIKLATDIRTSLSVMMLSRLSYSLTLASTSLYQMLASEESMDISHVIYFSISLIGMVMDFLPLCYLGTVYTSQLSSVAEAAYSMPWWEYGPSVSKYILLIMIRSQQYMYLTAFHGVFHINQELFVSVMKTAYSIFTVLQTMKIKTRE